MYGQAVTKSGHDISAETISVYILRNKNKRLQQ